MLPVPLNGVYTILILSATDLITSGSMQLPKRAFVYLSSISNPITLYKPLTFASLISIDLISARSFTFLTSAIISPSIGGVI